jgi:hypothetical protein
MPKRHKKKQRNTKAEEKKTDGSSRFFAVVIWTCCCPGLYQRTAHSLYCSISNYFHIFTFKQKEKGCSYSFLATMKMQLSVKLK